MRRADVAVDREALATILRVSRSGIVQTLIGMTSWLVLVRIISAFGSKALAGYTVAFRVVMFALMPSWGLGGAAATLVGQNLGAGNPARAEQAVWRAAFYNLVFLGAVGLCLALTGQRVVALFSDDPAVVVEGGRCLRIVALGFPLYAYGMVVSQAFNGAGDTRTPTWINFGCFWVLGDPDRLPAVGTALRDGADRRLPRDHPRLLVAGGGRRSRSSAAGAGSWSSCRRTPPDAHPLRTAASRPSAPSGTSRCASPSRATPPWCRPTCRIRR